MSDDAALDALDAYVDALATSDASDARAALLEAHPELADELAMIESLQRAADSLAIDVTPRETEGAPPRGRLLPPGTRLGDHVLEELIGTGGMGEVYRARHEVLGRDVAIKVLRRYLADEPEAAARFRAEVQTLASLGPHPNVVTALHASEHEGRLYFVMEHVPGEDLSRLVRRDGPLPPAEAIDVVAQAARGLAHAHAGGIVHRDIKPSNLRRTPDGVVKVVDLGLASLAPRDVVDESSGRQTWVDELVGSLDYMAPEQADDPGVADARADLYSLGCTMYFLLEGRAPFADRLALKKLMAHAIDPPPPLTVEVPAAVRSVLAQLLEKDPAARPASAEALVAALEAARPAVDAPVGDERPTQAPEATRSAGPWRVVALVAVLVALAALGGLAWGLLRPTEGAGLREGGGVSGALDADDARRPKVGARFDAYAVTVEEGRTYIWTARSRAFDPVLLLRADGWEVDVNDDAPGLGTAAQIVWTADRSGEVEIVASASDREASGAYHVEMDRLRVPALALDGPIAGALDASDARLPSDDSRLDRYWMRVESGQTYVLEMRGEGFTPYLFLENDDHTPFAAGQPIDERTARLVYVAEQAGAVFVIANAARPTDTGAYTLSAANREGGDEVLSERGVLGDGDLTLAEDGSWYDEYPLPVRAGHRYVITMQSEELDPYLLLVGEHDERLAQNDDADGTNSRIVYTAPADARLRVFANSYAAGMRGGYTVSARELPP